MSINFVKRVSSMDHVLSRPELNALAEFLCNNLELIGDATGIVWQYTKIGRFYLWRSQFLKDVAGERNKKKREIRIKMAELLGQAYSLVLNLPDGVTEDDYLKDIRGGILELLVTKFVESRYSHVETNCSIEINGKNVAFKTVDVAGTDSLDAPLRGELYECKVSNAFIKDMHLSFIKKLRQQLDAVGFKGVLACIVSCENRLQLKNTFKKLGYPTQKMICREDIICLKTYDDVLRVLN